MDQQPFRLDGSFDLTLLRRTLEEKGFTQPALAELLKPGDVKGTSVLALDRATALCRASGSTPLCVLARLFVLAQAVPEEAVREALAPVNLDPLAAMGLLQKDPRGVRAAFSLLPSDGLVLAHDFRAAATGAANGPDYVPGVGPASIVVANMTVRRPVESAFDLGTGLGYHALLAARHAQRVIATDINPRALSIAALNARLNGIENVEFRGGSLFEPVEGCQFDLIVSNPPFVISPRVEYYYRDGGGLAERPTGDTISEQVVRGLPRSLREGGFATVLCNWQHKSEADWADRPRQWVTDSGCDAWILASEHLDPIEYAIHWLPESAATTTDEYGRLLDEWLAYFERLGIGMVTPGTVILRRRSGGRNWVRTEQAPSGGTGSCSGQVQRIFAAQDFLNGLPDERSLLEKALVLTPEHELRYAMAAANEVWDVRRAELRQTEGFPFVGEVDRLVSTILVRCDGRRPLGEVISQVAEHFHADPEETARLAVGVIRRLIQSGFLVESSQ